MIRVTPPQKQALAITTVIAIVLSAYFLKHYIMLVIVATIAAFLFNSPYQKLLKRWNNKSKAATATLLLTFIAVIIPVTIVIAITSVQLVHIVDVIKQSGQNTNVSNLMDHFVQYVNNLFNSVGISYRLSVDTVRSALSSGLQAIGENILSGLGSFLGGIASFISTFIIYIYVFISLLVNQDKLLELFRQLNPLGKDISDLYTRRAGVMTRAMVKGQFIIALVQGITDAFFLYLAGWHSTFFFFTVLLTFLSIIPLGGGIIVIPIGILMILTGHIWQGALVLGGHFLIVTNEDNVLRPKLVPDETRLDPALTLLSVFSGLFFFGFIGIVLGPVIMILIVTTLQVYLEVYKNIESINKKGVSKSNSMTTKLKFWKRHKSTA